MSKRADNESTTAQFGASNIRDFRRAVARVSDDVRRTLMGNNIFWTVAQTMSERGMDMQNVVWEMAHAFDEIVRSEGRDSVEEFSTLIDMTVYPSEARKP